MLEKIENIQMKHIYILLNKEKKREEEDYRKKYKLQEI